MKVIDVLIENIHVGDWHRRDMGEPLRRNWGTGSRDQNRPQLRTIFQSHEALISPPNAPVRSPFDEGGRMLCQPLELGVPPAC
jgi:hypothetical protein